MSPQSPMPPELLVISAVQLPRSPFCQQPPRTTSSTLATVDLWPAGTSTGGVLPGAGSGGGTSGPGCPEMFSAPTVGETQMPDAGWVEAFSPPPLTESPQHAQDDCHRGQRCN